MTPDRFSVEAFEFFVHRTRTRFPFRYGIASMTEVPHLLVRTRLRTHAGSSPGLASEGLPPKWFTKNPATTFEQDLPEMLEVIGRAARLGLEVARQPVTFFEFWRELYRQLAAWAQARGVAPLLANLGVSLIERVVLDGLCRAVGEPFQRMVRTNRLGIRLGEVYAELESAQPADLLPARPLEHCFVRHTVGLGDPLAPGDILEGERLDDGLPQDLESSIRLYGLRYFKVKLFGQPERDFARLADVCRVLARTTRGDYAVTLDGNENFKDLGAFREFWRAARAEPALRELWSRVLVVEQPVHRDHALDESVRAVLANWSDAPALIIDESDAALGDVPRALTLGYAGASHKSCKGILKGLANACLLEARRRRGQPAVLTGEDLCTLGPVALLQDLATMALAGIEHVERNGHHYYRGLSMWPQDWQDATLKAHGDVYARHDAGFACVQIRAGRISLRTVNAAPFGLQPLLDPACFEQLQIQSGPFAT